MANDDGVPQELKDEVDRIRQEEGGDQGDDEGEGQVEVKLSRRQAAKQRDQEDRAAETARANEILEASRAAAEEAKSLRAERAKDAERMARLEGLLEATVVHQREQVVQQPREKYEPAENIYRKKMRDASAALAAGKLDDYHDLQREANEAILNERIAIAQMQVTRAIPQQQQVFQKPDWVSAIESQYGDVLMHPNGQNTVVNFHNIMFGSNQRATPESLSKAYGRAQEELGLKSSQDEKKTVERKRAMLSGGRVNGSNKTGGGGKEEYVNVPKNYKEIARRAGMKPEDYLRSYAESNPKDVSRE